MIERGEIYWVDLGAALGSRPAKRRPVVVVSANHFNRSRLSTVIVAVVTSNTDRAAIPGNVFLPASRSGLPRDSAVELTSLATMNKSELDGRVGSLPDDLLHAIDQGLRFAFGLV